MPKAFSVFLFLITIFFFALPVQAATIDTADVNGKNLVGGQPNVSAAERLTFTAQGTGYGKYVFSVAAPNQQGLTAPRAYVEIRANQGCNEIQIVGVSIEECSSTDTSKQGWGMRFKMDNPVSSGQYMFGVYQVIGNNTVLIQNFQFTVGGSTNPGPPIAPRFGIPNPLFTSITGPGPGPSGVLQLQQLILRIINLSVGLAFIALIVVLIYGGIRYLTSGGDTKSVQAASMAITWGLLGILFLALAWLILQLIENFTGVQVTQFCIGFPGTQTNCQ